MLTVSVRLTRARSRGADYEAVVGRVDGRSGSSVAGPHDTRGSRATSPVVTALNAPGLACYARRIPAGSLARDVLGVTGGDPLRDVAEAER